MFLYNTIICLLFQSHWDQHDRCLQQFPCKQQFLLVCHFVSVHIILLAITTYCMQENFLKDAGSPYIVFILGVCCMVSCYGKIYMYIYIIREATVLLLHWNVYGKYRRSIAGETFRVKRGETEHNSRLQFWHRTVNKLWYPRVQVSVYY